MNIKIKVLPVSIILLVCAPMFAWGNNIKLRMFNMKGEIHLIESNVKRKCHINAVLTANSTLEIVKGEATLITEDLSKIVIKDAGKYNYSSIIDKLSEPKENIQSRFFNYLKKLIINDKPEESNPGGVIRGNNFIIRPVDSVVVLGNAIPITRANHFTDKIKLIVRNIEGHVLHQQIFDQEEVILKMEDQKWWEAGWYYFTFYHTNDKIQQVCRIHIPSDEERTEILQHYDWIFDGISGEMPSDQRLSLGYKVLETNKIYLYYH